MFIVVFLVMLPVFLETKKYNVAASSIDLLRVVSGCACSIPLE
jgi:hypothetical protein